MDPQLFEIGMLLCFAVSWPFSIRKSWTSWSTKGKSGGFMCIVIIGYIFGITAKFVGGNVNYVLAFYVFDMMLVATDLALWVRNRRFEKRNAKYL